MIDETKKADNDPKVFSHMEHVDVIIEGMAEELTDLAELKNKRMDLLVKHGNITQYADFLKDGGLADIKYKNMKGYLAGVMEHMCIYKVEKANMVAQMAEIEANLKAMTSTSKAKRALDERSAVAAAIAVKHAELVELRKLHNLHNARM